MAADVSKSGDREQLTKSRERLRTRRRTAPTSKPELVVVREFDETESERERYKQVARALGFALTHVRSEDLQAQMTQWVAGSGLREALPEMRPRSAEFLTCGEAVRDAMRHLREELGRALAAMAVLVVLAGSGCDGGGYGVRWTMSKAFAVRVSEGVPYLQTEVVRALREGLGQLGGTLTTDKPTDQIITVEYDPDCVCRGCLGDNVKSDRTAAYVAQREYDRIAVCPVSHAAIADLGQARAADMILKHELGHVLGLIEHQPTGLMQGVVNDRLTVGEFAQSDLMAICATGRVMSLVCQRL